MEASELPMMEMILGQIMTLKSICILGKRGNDFETNL